MKLVVMTPPVAKARPRVAGRHGRAHAYTPTKTSEAEWRIRTAWLERFPRHAPLEGPLALQITIWLPRPKSMPKRLQEFAQPTTRPDTDNYAKTVLDALNGVAFADDSQVVMLIAWKRYAPGSGYWEIDLAPSAPTSRPNAPANDLEEAANGSSSA